MTDSGADAVVSPGGDAELRVLVVDDDEMDRRIVRRNIERGSLDVALSESDGDAATLDLIAGGEFDCILLDFNIPRGDGLSVLREMRAMGVKTPVIVMTGHGDEQLAVELMKAGASDYITKASLTPERLSRSLRYAVDLSRAAMATQAAETEIRTSADSTRFLSEASRAISASLDIRDTMQAVASLSVPRLGDYCFVYGEIGNSAIVVGDHADPAQRHLIGELVSVLGGRGKNTTPAIIAAVRTGKLQRLTVTEAMMRAAALHEREIEVYLALKPHEVVVAPLLARGTVMGAIGFVRCRPEPYDLRTIAIIEDLAQRAAMAIDNARLFGMMSEAKRHAEESARRTERLQELTAALAASANEREVGDLIMRHGVLPAGAFAGVIAEPVEEGELIELRTCVGYPAQACMNVGRQWTADTPIPLAEAIRTGEPVFVESPEAWAERYPEPYTPGGAPAPPSSSRAWAALPLHGDNGVRGAILWTFNTPQHFTEEQRAYMGAVAQQGAQALERARLRDAELHARAEAEEANRAKSDFLARMSHDLRTPLNAIGGYSQLIEEGIYGVPTEGQLQSIRRIRRAQEHLLTLINDVLSFAKLEAGQVKVEVSDVPLTDIVGALRSLMEPQILAKGLNFAIVEGEPRLVIRTDSERVVQIMGNLLTNAMKFTSAGGSVTLGWKSDGSHVAIFVSDTGCGIPPERIEAVFNPFVQVGGPATSGREGVGLGLAIGRELARMLDGDLSAESVPGVGSRFTLRVPLSHRTARELTPAL